MELPVAHHELALVDGDTLAKLHGYSSVTSSCRAWWSSLGIEAVTGRKNMYDPKQVRLRMDIAAKLHRVDSDDAKVSLVEQRRTRKYAH